METKRINPVALRTQKSIADAFLSLLQETDYGTITIANICRNAHIVRKTFYNNYQSKDHLVRSLITEVLIEFERALDLNTMGIHEILLDIFQFVHTNKEPLLLFHTRGLLPLAYKTISDYIINQQLLIRFNKGGFDPRAYRYISAQVAAVLISVIETWIENDCSESIEYLTHLTEAMISKPLASFQIE